MGKQVVGIGLVGSSFMGRCHANAFRSVSGLFDVPVTPRLEMLADATDELAKHSALALGLARGTGDWRSLVADDAVDIVAITAPNLLHAPIAHAAIDAGKTVYCETPLSMTAALAFGITQAAEAVGIVTLVGFNFLRNPLIKLARYLLGPIAEVQADCRTIYAIRPKTLGASERAPVEVDDITHALVRYTNGVSGRIEANWAATARAMHVSWEITGTTGALAFCQERMNEPLIWSGTAGRSGCKRIEADPSHPPYGAFCPASGHHLGFSDLKVIVVAELLSAHAGGVTCGPDFREPYEVQRTVKASNTLMPLANGCRSEDVAGLCSLLPVQVLHSGSTALAGLQAGPSDHGDCHQTCFKVSMLQTVA